MWGIAQVPAASDQEFNEILSLDINQLTVTSVTKTPEKSSDAAAAIYVITSEDLKRTGITTIPEALRMVPGVQVEQTGSHNWSVSIRGFNNQFGTRGRAFADHFANKLLVLIDGRSIYTPAFSGVYWDTQDTVIEDIDRIEVIRGPGATLWGANAVNGVINIVTKQATHTQGKYLSVAGGSNEYLTTEGRYGGVVDNDTFYRVYAKQRRRGEFETIDHQKAHDAWSSLSSGFRLDKPQEDNHYTIQGNIYSNDEESFNSAAALTPPVIRNFIANNTNTGVNILTRWEHSISDSSNTSMQFYFDNYKRETTTTSSLTPSQEVNTLDFDFQHVFDATDRNKIVWGGGYRFNYDNLELEPAASLQDPQESYATWNVFLQDGYAIIEDKLLLTVGSKFEYNDFTGSEIQPNIRVTWKENDTRTAWAAISYAVSSPSRLADSGIILTSVIPGTPVRANQFTGNTTLVSEELLAYEVGYRIYPRPGLSLDVTAFYNDYDKLTTLTIGTPFVRNNMIITPITPANTGYGYTYGAEGAAHWKVTPYWELAASYSFINLHLNAFGRVASDIQTTEDAVPQHQFSVRSYFNLPHDAQWNNIIYYVDELKATNRAVLHLDPNIRFDTQLEWKPTRNMEYTITGRNLFNAPHAEFPGSPITLVGPSFVGNVAWRF